MRRIDSRGAQVRHLGHRDLSGARGVGAGVGKQFEADDFVLVDDIADADFVLNMFDAEDPKASGAPRAAPTRPRSTS